MPLGLILAAAFIGPAAADPGDPRAYARARAAAAEGDAASAASAYARALAAAPDDGMVAARAYRQALAAGDYALAVRAAAVMERGGGAPSDAALVAFTQAVRLRQWHAAEAAVARVEAGPLDFLAPVLRGWLALAQGGDSIAPLDAAGSNALGARYIAEHRALLLIASGRIGPGVATLRSLLGGADARIELRVDAARLLAGKRQAALARQLLAGNSPEMSEMRVQALKGARATAAFGASRLFLRLAQDLDDDATLPLSILLTRSSLELDPSDDRARLFLAQALSRGGYPDEALAVLAAVPAKSLFAAGARAVGVAVLDRAGRAEAALAEARRLARGRGATAADVRALGDLLARSGDHAGAADAYAMAIARADGAADWTLRLLHGAALDRAGRWGEALPELRRAVALAPDEPLALNQLGYALVERGEDLDAARATLERAYRLDPSSASIADSLGWAHYRSGDYAAALPLLERAAQTQPANATIQEHLGDLYWRLGRRFEARYAWRAAQVTAEGEIAARVAAKLRDGMPDA